MTLSSDTDFRLLVLSFGTIGNRCQNLKVLGLSNQKQLFIAVQASHIDIAGGSDDHTAARANILAGAGLAGSHCAKIRSAVSACSRDLETAELVPIQKNVGQVVFQNHFQKLVAGFGDRPAVLVMVIDNQTVGFGCRLELAVVVGVASAAILNAVNVVPVVNHFMQKGGGNLFNGSGQRSRSDVDFMGATQRGNPGVLPQREMAIGFWRGLDGDGGS